MKHCEAHKQQLIIIFKLCNSVAAPHMKLEHFQVSALIWRGLDWCKQNSVTLISTLGNLQNLQYELNLPKYWAFVHLALTFVDKTSASNMCL